jgi:hypothetical protein
VALLQACYPDLENGRDAVPSWYPAYASTPPENRADNIATCDSPNAPYVTSQRRAVFDAVRLIVAELASRQSWSLAHSLRKITNKQ